MLQHLVTTPGALDTPAQTAPQRGTTDGAAYVALLGPDGQPVGTPARPLSMRRSHGAPSDTRILTDSAPAGGGILTWAGAAPNAATFTPRATGAQGWIYIPMRSAGFFRALILIRSTVNQAGTSTLVPARLDSTPRSMQNSIGVVAIAASSDGIDSAWYAPSPVVVAAGGCLQHPLLDDCPFDGFGLYVSYATAPTAGTLTYEVHRW